MKFSFSIKKENQKEIHELAAKYINNIRNIKELSNSNTGIKFAVIKQDEKSLDIEMFQPDLCFFQYQVIGLVSLLHKENPVIKVPFVTMDIPSDIIEKCITEKRSIVLYDTKKHIFVYGNPKEIDELINKELECQHCNYAYGINLLIVILLSFINNINK